MSRCRYCNAEIRFVHTAASNGKRLMPIDPEPDPAGNVELVRSASRNQTEAVVHTPGQTTIPIPGDDPIRYMPHFVTCPNYERPTTNDDLMTGGMRCNGPAVVKGVETRSSKLTTHLVECRTLRGHGGRCEPKVGWLHDHDCHTNGCDRPELVARYDKETP